MRERLPKITIKPDVSPDKFIKRLLDLTSIQETWSVKNSNIEETDIKYVLFALHDEVASEFNVPVGVMAHFGHFPDLDGNRIRVQMKAMIWNSVEPTYDSYVKAANSLKPFLSRYNKQFKTRVRLNVQTREDLIPKLSPVAAKYFSLFISKANKSALHPMDWGPFYGFIYVSYRLRSKLTEADIAYLLTREGFGADYAGHIADVYRHGRGILKGGCPETSWGIMELDKKFLEIRAKYSADTSHRS